MAGVGLTHGGFYSYFKSKSDLYAGPRMFLHGPGMEELLGRRACGFVIDRRRVASCPRLICLASISRMSRNSCPMVALPTDVARSGVSARRAFETVFKAMVSVLGRSLTQNGRRHRTTAQAIAALSIGGMVVARTMVDRALADELRAACMSVALDLGGWDKKRKSKKRKIQTIPTAPSGCVRKPLRGSYRLMFAKVPACPHPTDPASRYSRRPSC